MPGVAAAEPSKEIPHALTFSGLLFLLLFVKEFLSPCLLQQQPEMQLSA